MPRRPRSVTLLITLLALLASSLVLLTTAPSARAAESLLSQGKAATDSSHEGAGLTASAAVDGNLTGTRWASEWRDPQWIQVDLGATADLNRVVLTWESAYGKAYQIQASDNGSDWRTLKTVTDGDGGTDELAVSGSGRYVRMYGTARAGGYGYSLWEFQVYGSTTGTPPAPAAPSASPDRRATGS